MRSTTLACILLIVVGSVSLMAAQATAVQTHADMGFIGGIFVFTTGVVIGAIGTLIGAGGGFIHVPVLMIFYGFSPQHAIGTSMAVVMLNAISGTFAYVAQKRIDYEIGLRFAVAACPGVVFGALLTRYFTVRGFGTAFGVLLILVSYYLFSGIELSVVRTKAAQAPKIRRLKDSTGEEYTYAPDMSVGFAASIFIGKLSGLFGIGGGIIHVPLMYSVLGIPVHVATATSHFILAITSGLGFIVFVGLGYVDLNYAVALGVGTILGATWGAHLSLKTHPSVIKKMIAVCLTLLAVKLIMGAG
ncbi:MAG: sulfite exporter TauE/SafE family protein [Acidobacteriota bacterium]